MALFKRASDGSKLTFNCIGLTDDEVKDITKLVEENGGEIGESELPLIFMPKCKYREDLNPRSFRAYDLKFIKICAKKGKLVNMQKYRLGPKKLGEQAIISIFINGDCAMQELQETVITPDLVSSNELDDSSSADIDPKTIKLSQSYKESQIIIPNLVNQSQNSGELTEPPILPIPLNSQDSYYTATDEILVKPEPMDSQEWEFIPYSVKKKQFDTSNLKTTPSANTFLKTLKKSQNVNGEETLSPEDPIHIVSSSSPRLNHENITQLNSNSMEIEASQLVVHLPATKIDELPRVTTAIPLTARLFTQKCLNPETASQICGISPRKATITPQSKVALIIDNNINHSDETSDDDELPTNENSSLKDSAPWIAPGDHCLSEQNINNRVHPTSEYMERDGVKIPLLRKELTSNEKLICKKLITTQPRNESIEQDSSSTVDKEDSNRDVTPVKKSKKISNFVSKKKPVVKQINRKMIVSDSDDELLINPHNRINKTLENGSSTRRKKIQPNRNEKNSFDNQQPGTSGLKMRPCKNIQSHSDSTDTELAQTIPKSNLHRRINKKKFPSSNCSPSIYVISSNSDEENVTSAKRKKSEDVPVRRNKVKLNHPAINSLPPADNHSNAKEISVESDIDSDQSDDNRNNIDSATDYSTDDYIENNRTKVPNRGSRKEKALRYAKHWRKKLEEDRVVKTEVTNMKFSRAEQQIMVNFLCSYPNVELVRPKGFKIWQELLNKELLTNRTSQSLQNHFQKHLLPRIHTFYRGMSEVHKNQFKALLSRHNS